MGNRKIIQIAIRPMGNIVALCEDGTLWVQLNNGKWAQIDTSQRA